MSTDIYAYLYVAKHIDLCQYGMYEKNYFGLLPPIIAKAS